MDVLYFTAGGKKGEKVYSTTTYIGQLRAPGYNKSLPVVAGAERLDGLKSWPVSISNCGA